MYGLYLQTQENKVCVVCAYVIYTNDYKIDLLQALKN